MLRFAAAARSSVSALQGCTPVSAANGSVRGLAKKAPAAAIRRVTGEGFLAHIKVSTNNTIVTVTDAQGNTIKTASTGNYGFKGAKRSTSYAAQVVGTEVAREVKKMGIEDVDVHVKGLGAGRLTAVRALTTGGLRIKSITDRTPVPHNGCRPKKARRL